MLRTSPRAKDALGMTGVVAGLGIEDPTCNGGMWGTRRFGMTRLLFGWQTRREGGDPLVPRGKPSSREALLRMTTEDRADASRHKAGWAPAERRTGKNACATCLARRGVARRSHTPERPHTQDARRGKPAATSSTQRRGIRAQAGVPVPQVRLFGAEGVHRGDGRGTVGWDKRGREAAQDEGHGGHG
jgi:hypothetical protein